MHCFSKSACRQTARKQITTWGQGWKGELRGMGWEWRRLRVKNEEDVWAPFGRTFWFGKFANNVLDLLGFSSQVATTCREGVFFAFLSKVAFYLSPPPAWGGLPCPVPLSARIIFLIMGFNWQTSLFALFLFIFTLSYASLPPTQILRFYHNKGIFELPSALLFCSKPMMEQTAIMYWVSWEASPLNWPFPT